MLKAAALYSALTLLLAYPLALHPASGAMPGDPDTDLFIWTLAWNTHAVTTDPLSIFDANIYHPHPRTLAFSENLIGSTLFAAPVIWTTGDQLLALNVVALSSIVLSGMGAFLLARRLGLGMPAALLCGMIFAFSPARFFRLGQIHLTTIHWVPFCLAFLHTYLDGGRRRDLWMGIGLFTLQAFTSGHGAVFLAVAIVCMLAWRFALGEPLAPLQRLRDVGLPGVLLAVPLLLLALPYRYVQQAHGLRRTLVDWETPVSSFFASLTPLHNWIFDATGVAFAEEPSANLFPGCLVLALARAACAIPRTSRGASRVPPPSRSPMQRTAATLTVLSVSAALVALYIHAEGAIRIRAGGSLIASARDPWRAWIVAAAAAGLRMLLTRNVPFVPATGLAQLEAWRSAVGARWRTDPLPPYAILAIFSILLAAGPPIGLWPLVYDLPAFNFLRVPSRFMLLAILGMAVLGAIAFDRLARGMSARFRTAATIAAGAVLVAECFTVPLPGHRPYGVEIPEADRWLATLGGPIVVAELPSDYFNERRQSTYMLHSTAHWQKTVHGHSGIRTPLHHDLFEKLRGFPSDASFDALTSVGVTHIVIHPEMYDAADWLRASTAFPQFHDRVEQVYNDGRSQVYRLRPRLSY